MNETTQVRNAVEQWIVDTYALWVEYAEGSRRRIGGFQKNENNAFTFQKILEQDWEITNRENGLEEVKQLSARASHHHPETDAWDYCRATQLLGMFYIVGFINREELHRRSCEIGRLMQEHYHSWEELCASYLAGHALWCSRVFGQHEAGERSSQRQALYSRLKEQTDGPYKIPWNLTLDPASYEDTEHTYERWVTQEETWMQSYSRRILKKYLTIMAPLTVLGCSALMGGIMAVSGSDKPVAGFLMGGIAGIIVTGIVLIFIAAGLRPGKMANSIETAIKGLNMGERERDLLGRELLDAAMDPRRRLDYQNHGAGSRNTPARLLVSENYLYLAGSYPLAILVRRFDVDHMEAGQEKKVVTVRKGGRMCVKTVAIYTIYFYCNSSRGARLEGSTRADIGMGFFDSSIRDRAFAMINKL